MVRSVVVLDNLGELAPGILRVVAAVNPMRLTWPDDEKKNVPCFVLFVAIDRREEAKNALATSHCFSRILFSFSSAGVHGEMADAPSACCAATELSSLMMVRCLRCQGDTWVSSFLLAVTFNGATHEQILLCSEIEIDKENQWLNTYVYIYSETLQAKLSTHQWRVLFHCLLAFAVVWPL